MEGMHTNQEVNVCVCLLSSPDWVFVSSITIRDRHRPLEFEPELGSV